MFKEIGAMMSLLNNKGKMQEEMAKLQESIARITAEGSAGGGMVTVKVNGKLELLSCRISEELYKQTDREMLEDLVVVASNQALDKARKLLAEETSKMAANMGLPAGMLGGLAGGIPGIG